MRGFRTYYVVKTLIWCAFAIALLQIESGCSGCSPSGRRGYSNSGTNKPQDTDNRRASIRREPKGNNDLINRTLPLNELYNKYKKSVFLIYTSDGSNDYQGSGFFISNDGLAISNYHVFEGTSQGLEIIKTIDGKQFKIADVLEKNKECDYIIFRVKIDSYIIQNPLIVGSQSPIIGEDVFAIGNPKGLEHTLSKGIISQIRSVYQENDYIQITAEITHGSSGGPLFNMNGQVIGITTAGVGEADLNFAINIEKLRLRRFLH